MMNHCGSMVEQAPHLLKGAVGEQIAAAIAKAAGCKIIGRNWRCGKLELDLIGEEDGEIVFMEVKTRTKRARGGGPGAITAKKRQHLIKAAQAWLLSHNAWRKPCRFDVICLYGSETYSLEHYKNAFCPTLDSRDSHWQPW